MKDKILYPIMLMMISIGLSQCNLAQLAGNTNSSTNNSSSDILTATENSDESEVEAALTSAIQSLTQSSNSTVTLNAAQSNLTTNYLTTGARAHRFRCLDSSSVYESFSCDNDTGEMTRTVTLTDCEIDNDHREGVLNGSFTNAVTNGGDGFCGLNYTIDFANMVMGRDDNNAIHTHDTDDDGMVFTFTNKKGHEVIATRTASRATTFSEALDANEDGIAEEVLATIEKEVSIIHEIEGEEVHNMTLFTSEESFTINNTSDDEETESEEDATEKEADDSETLALADDSNEESIEDENIDLEDDDSEDSEEEEESDDDSETDTSDDNGTNTIQLSYPQHRLVFDEDGGVISRTIESGNLVIDHNKAKVRLVFDVGEDGLTFEPDVCGPVEGSMTITGYAINDDGSIGEKVGEGSMSFSDGDVDSASFEGQQLNLKPLPCH